MTPVLVKKIIQKNNTQFSIEWSDGKIMDYKLCDLQRKCPCAGCTDEVTGKRMHNPENIPEDQRAHKITSVGRYALRIQFKTGCSNGIYSFSMLRQGY